METMRCRLFMVGLTLLLAASGPRLMAQEKPEPPRVLFTNPLVISPGQPVTLTLRGFKLDAADKVLVMGLSAPLETTIKKKEKQGPPEKVEAKDCGDTIVDVEFTLPADFTGEGISLVVQTPAGPTEARSARVLAKDKLVSEMEPNDGFRKAQPVEAGKTIVGSIQSPRDVDVFQLAGKAGQTVSLDVFAAKAGSILDPQLTIYGSRGQIIAASDDAGGSRDSLLELALPADDTYRIVLQDATDRGGATHPYLLIITGQ